MSLGVNLLFKIAGEVAKKLGDDYDIEIVEGHHRFKKDAPSGTAMGLADAILKSTGKTRDALSYDRHGDDAVRKRGEIGMHALRIGDEVGRHTAYFAALGERLELTHVATNRDTFVHGALRAAKWLAGQKPGRYAIADVLGLEEGSVVQLDRSSEDPVDVYVNDRLVARGEVVVVNDQFAVRLTEVVSPIADE